MTLALAQAQQAVAAALAQARASDAPPLAVIVLDAGGHPVAFAREDGASLFRFDIARAKALGALGMGADTDVLAARAQKNPVFFGSVSAVVGGQIAFSPGGVLIRDPAGVLIGAIGISGDTGERDMEFAKAGIAAIDFNKGSST
jgi:uncharacterized protein GlcG (DUF336 family)